MSRIEEGLAYLEHYGVKGMKWGVRKDSSGGGRGKNKVVGNEQGRDITKADVKWKAKNSTPKVYIQTHNAVAAGVNKELPALNAKYKGQDLGWNGKQHTTAAGKKYVKEYESICTKVANQVIKDTFGTSPSGNWTADAKYSLKNGFEVNIKPTEKVEHSGIEETEDGLIMTIPVTFDAAGFMKPIGSVQHDDMETEVYLEHYGVKGMKWGVRRSEAQLASARKQRKAEAKANKAGNKAEKKRRKKAVATRRVVDEKELDELIRRLDKEKRLKSLVSEDTPASKAAVGKMLGDTGSQVAKQVLAGVAVSVVSVAIANKMGDKGKDGADAAKNTAKEIQKAIKVGGKFKDK